MAKFEQFEAKNVLGGRERARFNFGLGRNNKGKSGGGGWATEDPNRDLKKLPQEVADEVAEKMGRVEGSTGSSGSMRVYEVKDANGKVRRILDF